MKRPDGGNPGFAPDLFGAGKNGFKDNPLNPPPTQLDAAIFNNVVESLCRLVENSGQTLDGLDFDQIWLAVTNAVLTDPAISNGGSLTLEDSSMLVVEADGGNGGSSISFAGTNAAAVFASGAVLQTVIGAVVQFLGSVTIGTTAAQTLTVNSLAELNENVTLAASKSITGGAGTSITLGSGASIDLTDTDGVVQAGELAFYSDATPSTTTGVMQFQGRWLTVGLNSIARKVSIPVESFVAGDVNTGAPISDTGASISVVVDTGDILELELDMESTNTSTANLINVQIDVGGAPVGGTATRRVVANNEYISIRRVFSYTAGAPAALTIKARHGASAGTTTSRNIRILARHANN